MKIDFLKPFQTFWSIVYGKTLSPLLDLALRRAEGKAAPNDEKDYMADAEWAIAEQQPTGSRIAIWAVGIALLLLIIWATFAELDEVTRGDGKVIPSSQIQVMQSLDGGMVSSILVEEGQQVKKGQLLLTIDPTRFESSLRENRAQYLAALAKAARLDALATGKPFVAPELVVKESPEIVAQEKAAFEAKKAEVESNQMIARQQLTQRRQELKEVTARRDQATQSYALTVRELEVTRPLLKSGAVSEVELLRLERDVARLLGERDAANAQIPRLQASIAEAEAKVNEIALTMRNQVYNELSEINVKVSALAEGSIGLADRVKQAEVRSPVNGIVKKLFTNTVGGVVQPGKEVIEIVPQDDELLVEVRVQPKDIAFLHPGQEALIKFTAYDFSVYGGLEAKLELISADTLLDEKGNPYYLARLKTTQNHIGPKNMPIIPGMVAEADIKTGKKSLLTYLMKPVVRAKAAALSER
jgi:adhesin transport system membrane fusion protein